MSSPATQGIDPRIDRAISVLGVAALSVGAWFFSGLQSTVQDLTHAMGELRTSIAVLQRDAEDLDRLERRQDAFDARLRSLENK